MRKIHLSKRGATIGVVTGLAAGALGFAAATVGGNWTATTSTGSGYGKAIQMAVSTSSVAGDADNSVASHATNGLYPGASNKPLYVRVSNPNPFSIDVNSVSTTGTSAVTSGDTGNCASTNVTVSTTATTGTLLSSNTIAPGSSQVFSVPSALTMAGDAPNGCQGVAFSVSNVTVNATQTAS